MLPKLMILASSLAITGISVTAHAQRGAGARRGAQQQSAQKRTPLEQEQLRERVRQQVRTFILDKVVQFLALEPAAATKFADTQNRFDEQTHRIQMENGKLRREMWEATRNNGNGNGANVDPARLSRLVDTLLANRARIQQLEEARLRELRTILTPVQFVKYLAVQPRVTEKVREHLREVRKRLEGQPPPR